MPSYVTPKKNTAFIFYVGLASQADTKLLKANPTLAAGDVKVSIDGGAFANLATLPAVTPAAGTSVKVSLSSGEMNGDNITVVFSDAAGAEWCDQLINIQTSARQIDDLAFPATSGRGMVVDAAGLVDANTVKIGPSGSGTAQSAGDVYSKVDTEIADIQSRLPAALTADGNMKSDALRLGGTVQTGRDVGASVLVGDKTGFSLSTAGILAIWHQLTSAVVTAGTMGKLIVDYLDAAISSRSTYAGGDTGGTTTLLGRLTALRAAAIDNLDATVSSRSTLAAGAAMTLTSGERTAIANEVEAQIIDETDSEKVLTAITDKIAAVNPSLDDLTLAGIASAVRTELATELARIDAAVSSRVDGAGVRTAVGLGSANLDTQLTAIDDYLDTEIAAIKAKTDNLPSDPADASDVAAAFATVNGTLGTIAAYVDTEVGAIKAKTDNLPSDPADASDIATATTAISSAIAALNNVSTAQVQTAAAAALAAYDAPTHAEMTAELATADDATLAAIAALHDVSTSDVQTAAAAALTAYDPPTHAEMTAELASADDAVLAAIDALPTNAELATALAGADDAVLLAIASSSAPTAEEVADAVHGAAIEGSVTHAELVRGMSAVLMGKGLGTPASPFRDVNDTTDRVAATVDEDGERTAVTLELT